MGKEVTTALITGIAAGVVGSLIAGWIVYRLQRRADRELAVESGQLDRPELVLLLRDAHGFVTTRGPGPASSQMLRWWHFLDPSDDFIRMHPITVMVGNVGHAAAKGVVLRLRVPLYLAEDEGNTPEYEMKRGISPGAELKRQIYSGYVVTSVYTPVVAPGIAVELEANLILRSTLIKDEVEVAAADGTPHTVRYQMELGTKVTVDATDDTGMGPPLVIDVQVSPEPMMTKLRRDIRKVDAEERERFGVGRHAWRHPLRFNRFLAQRPAVGHHHPVTVHTGEEELNETKPKVPFRSYSAVCFGQDWLLSTWAAEDPELQAITAVRGLRRKSKLRRGQFFMGGRRGSIAVRSSAGRLPK